MKVAMNERSIDGTPQVIRWQTSVPVLRNTVSLRQLAVALGLPFGLVALVTGLSSGTGTDTLYALSLIVGVFVLAWLLIMVAYQGKYEVEFVLDNNGALCRTGAKQAKKNRVINTLTFILGLLTGKPAAAGAGMLAQSRQEVSLRWNRVTRVNYKPKNRTILLRDSWTENIALFCADENYEQVEAFVRRNISLPRKGDDR